MPITEDKALEILTELIKKPETQANEIPRIWEEILNVYNTRFSPPVEEPKKKKRRRPGGATTGWPAGVGRVEYTDWKNSQTAQGVTENLNPQEYKRLRDAGLIQAAAPRTEAKAEKAPAAKPEPKADKAEKAVPKAAKAGAAKADEKPKAAPKAEKASAGEKKPARAKK